MIGSFVFQTALTIGDWEVQARTLWIDKKNQIVYFIGFEQTPLEKHLYAVSLNEPGRVRLLTKQNYSYLIDFDEVIYRESL